jgi:outer membrane protein assembly factor BamA
VLQEERSFLRVSGGYRNTLTRRFFGIGPSAQERQETSYTDRMFYADAGLAYSLPAPLDDWVASFSLRGERHWLSDGEVDGDPDTQDLFPGLYDAADSAALGWLNAGLAWDTRDSVRNPYRGAALGATVQAAVLQENGETGAIYGLFADKILPLPPLFHDGGDAGEEHPPTDSLGLHFQTQLSSGQLPFFVRPTLGGSRILRGYIAGRWRDDAAWAAAVEYRFWIVPRGFTLWKNIRIERIGGAVFYEAGAVAADGSDLPRERVRHSYGFGGRATIERAVLFRLDLGFSEEGMNLAAGFGLSF